MSIAKTILEQLGGKIYNSIKNIGCVEAIINENW